MGLPSSVGGLRSTRASRGLDARALRGPLVEGERLKREEHKEHKEREWPQVGASDRPTCERGAMLGALVLSRGEGPQVACIRVKVDHKAGLWRSFLVEDLVMSKRSGSAELPHPRGARVRAERVAFTLWAEGGEGPRSAQA